MKHFKKRTIALVLASMISVAGSFATENYKNSLLGLGFEKGATGINMVVETKTPYSGALSLMRRDANTYVLILREVNTSLKTPDLTKAGGNIADVDIGTLPYTTNGVGYTKITVKTAIPIEIIPQNKVFIPKATGTRLLEPPVEKDVKIQNEEAIRRKEEQLKNLRNEQQENIQKDEQNNNSQQEAYSKNYADDTTENKSINNENTIEQNTQEPNYSTENQDSPLMLILGALLIIAFSAYMYIRAKNKLTDLTGENINISFDDENEEEQKRKETKTKQIKNTVKTLDKKYTAKTSVTEKTSQPIKTVSSEDLNVVDLDELFQETTKTSLTPEEEENLALEDFLSGFSFNEEEREPIEEEIFTYDKEFLEEILTRKDLKFSKDDILKLNKLLLTEITDDTMKNLNKYLVSKPVIKKPTQQEILEELVTSYSVSNNIIFTKDDVNALNQIITVELDKDFVTDLRTNPKRTQEIAKEITESKEIKQKPEEAKLLNVKEFLPDLSEEIKKQPAVKSSNYKPTVLELDANCEVETISVELDVDFSQPQTQTPKKEEAKISETGWETNTLQIADMLPDLQDALLHPEKYEKPKEEKVEVDEASLLNNLSNLTFKPFDDGTRNFEILNDLDDMEPEEEEIVEKLTLSEIQKELMDLGQTLEIIEPEVNPAYVAPIAKKESEKEETQEPIVENKEPLPIVQKTQVKQKTTLQKQNLKEQKMVAPPKTEMSVKTKSGTAKTNQLINKTKTQINQTTKCLWENQAFNVIRTVEFENNKGCHLAKNDTCYIVLGFIGDRLFKIKEYTELKSENIQARLSEKLDNGHLRYLVRMGITKFVIDVSNDTMQHVLDL